MNQTSGIVLDITKRHMIVLCDDGLFRNLPLPDTPPRVGERIRVQVDKNEVGGRKGQIFIWGVLVLAAVVFLTAMYIWYLLPEV